MVAVDQSDLITVQRFMRNGDRRKFWGGLQEKKKKKVRREDRIRRDLYRYLYIKYN